MPIKSDFEKSEEMRAYYEESSYFVDQIETFQSLETAFQKYRISKVLEIYSPGGNERILDLGCGWGTFSFVLAPLCKEVIGVDFSEKSIAICNQLAHKYPYDNVRFIQADAQDTGLDSEAFDVIVCADFFAHLYPRVAERVLDEIKRCLKRGGKIIIWTPHRGHIFEILKNRNIILKKDISLIHYKSMQWLLNSLGKRNLVVKKAYYVESHVPVLRSFERCFKSFLPVMRRRIAILAEK